MVMLPQQRVPIKPYHNTFEPCRSEDCRLHEESLDRLLDRIEKTVPNTGLQQFWDTRAPAAEVPPSMET